MAAPVQGVMGNSLYEKTLQTPTKFTVKTVMPLDLEHPELGSAEIHITFSRKDFAKLSAAEKEGRILPSKLPKLLNTWAKFNALEAPIRPDEIILRRNEPSILRTYDDKGVLLEKINLNKYSDWNKNAHKTKLDKTKDAFGKMSKIFKKSGEVTPVKTRKVPEPLYIVIRSA